MIIFPTTEQNVLTNFSMSQIPLGYIGYRVVLASWIICYNSVEKWILTLKAFLRVKCEK